MIVAVLQARSSSKRLPGKVLRPILGSPMLARQIERIRRCRSFETLVLATSDTADDDELAELADACGISCYRGSLDDVLDRFCKAAQPFAPDYVVRLTGDCPLADWTVIDAVTRFAVEGGYDYASNTIRPTFPDGLDVEVAKFSALETAWREATDTSDREHVMPFLHRQPARFKLGNFENTEDLSGLRWTVDEPEDFEMVRQVYEALYPSNSAFTMTDIRAFLSANPQIAAINSRIGRNEGLAGVRFRPASLDDAELLLGWRNDPVTRAMSINTEMIALETHSAWLRNRLRLAEPNIFICESAGIPCGMFRIDEDEVSYIVAPEFRGKGIATEMLTLVARRFGPKTARVKRSNEPSARAAAKAGHTIAWIDG